MAFPPHLPRNWTWRWPLLRTHTGVPLGNGRLGVLVWGEAGTLRLTLGLADLWDHRGGKPWDEGMTFAALRAVLEAGDEAGLREKFELPAVGRPDWPTRPTVLPLGRVDLHFPDGWRVEEGDLDFATGELTIKLVGAGGEEAEVQIRMGETAVAEGGGWVGLTWPDGLRPEMELRPAWEWVGEVLSKVGYEPPRTWREGDGSGWTQVLPADPAVAVAVRAGPTGGTIGVARGEHGKAAQAAATAVMRTVSAAEVANERAWWAQYWERVPDVEVPEKAAGFRVAFGLYKFGAAARPSGPALTLQGPWIEEHQLPPWSSDFHFNINVQMCIWPAYAGNQLAHLRPLFDLVEGWREQLRQQAKCFVGIEDGLLLPHSVDDRGTAMGGFWSGLVDQACTGWMALQMLEAWRFGYGEQAFLRQTVKPWLRGALRVFHAMAERRADGGWTLPVTVSPEYRGHAMNAWGADASFQLGCIHALAEGLEEVATALEEPCEPWVREFADGLPRALVGAPGGGRPRVLLWAGTDLEESHRHHSHWAGVYPWDVIEPTDPNWRPVLEATYTQWVERGMGKWTGWCLPWAAMLHARLGRPVPALAALDTWERVYTNEGHGTLHDPRNQADGGSVPQPETRPPHVPFDGHRRGELMQLDAGLAAAAATLDLLVHVRRGVHWLFTGAPPDWREVGFTKVLTRGGFLVSARRREGEVAFVRVQAVRGGTFRLRSPWGAGARVESAGRALVPTGEGVVACDLAAGKEVTFLKFEG